MYNLGERGVLVIVEAGGVEGAALDYRGGRLDLLPLLLLAEVAGGGLEGPAVTLVYAEH